MVNLPVTPVENCRQPLGGLFANRDDVLPDNGLSNYLDILRIWVDAFQLCHLDFPLPATKQKLNHSSLALAWLLRRLPVTHVGAEEHEAEGRTVRGHGAHVDVNCT